jgi:hypothetical protein
MSGACFVIGWNLVWTSLVILFIKHRLRIPLRMKDQEFVLGDEVIRGEAAYVFGRTRRTGTKSTARIVARRLVMGQLAVEGLRMSHKVEEHKVGPSTRHDDIF